MPRTYLDYQATTPLDPRVLEAMMPYLTERFGNAASASHPYGWEAEAAVKVARRQVADALGAHPDEIVWTSGATESINLALKGAAEAEQGGGRHLVTLATEHPATLDTCRNLEARGWSVTYMPVDATGVVEPSAVAAALRPDTVLVSIAHANNEIGTVQAIAEIGALVRAAGALFHVDAAQSFGKLPLANIPVDLLSLSSHKLYGPKGVGALYVRRRDPRVRLVSQIHGGGHQRGLRSGTLNVPAIVGLGVATTLALAEMDTEHLRLTQLRDQLYRRLATLEGVTLNGHPTRRLAGNLNVSFAQAPADAVIARLTGLALSSGAACSSASLEPSHVLRAIGVPDGLAKCTLRFGLGRPTTRDEVEAAADQVIEAVQAVRAANPMYGVE
ncbi:MAG: aromatic amino acid beta-eliminating lyase/threonine aldolase [Cyanobacteria bacterium RYN_339]|nr:aromatic amino acid beta-eliminating lyase/threonine aldolase [Cyanobacteria bacterium RYN_339]